MFSWSSICFENFIVASLTQWCLHGALNISKFMCRCPPLFRQCMMVRSCLHGMVVLWYDCNGTLNVLKSDCIGLPLLTLKDFMKDFECTSACRHDSYSHALSIQRLPSAHDFRNADCAMKTPLCRICNSIHIGRWHASWKVIGAAPIDRHWITYCIFTLKRSGSEILVTVYRMR